jgi:paraquat-inducible protein A
MLQELPTLRPGERATCPRCARTLTRQPTYALDRCLALSIAAAILLIVANVTPLMDLSVEGRTSSTTIIGGVIGMWNHGERVTALVVAFCAVIAPAGFIVSMLTVLVAALMPPAPRWIGEVLRWMRYLHIWSLQEVMMLGILVALVKIAELARVNAGLGIFCVGALTILFPAIIVNFDSREVWKRLRWADTVRLEDGPDEAAGGGA